MVGILDLVDLYPWLIGEQNQTSGEAKAQPDHRNQSNWSEPPHPASILAENLCKRLSPIGPHLLNISESIRVENLEALRTSRRHSRAA